jgi:hypothetical protein
MKNIPGRVLRLGEHFDFIQVISNPPNTSDLKKCRKLFREELNASLESAKFLYGGTKITSMQKKLKIK